MRKLKCSICGYVYDESAGIPNKGIAPGTKWEDLRLPAAKDLHTLKHSFDKMSVM